MAFMNRNGEKISYDCSELIKELELDIYEFGRDELVDVVTENDYGAIIYKDYNLVDDTDPTSAFELEPKETIKRITAGELMKLYMQELSID